LQQKKRFNLSRRTFSLVPLAVALFLARPSVLQAEGKTEYLIGREDVLDITVWQSPDLTKAVTVLSDGLIEYPVLGKIQAAGLTPKQLETVIREKLAQGYVKDPQVNVLVKEYNSKKILVFGEVSKPGLYKLKEDIPVLELLLMVDGVKPDAKRMTVIRASTASPDPVPSALLPASAENQSDPESSSVTEVDLIALLSKGDLSQNVKIKAGDTIYVSSGTGERYYVLGQVKKPGPYEWVQAITVLEAIKLADGFTARASQQRIKVIKNVGGGQEEIKVNVADIMKGKKKDDVVVNPGDTIVVPESWL
jgi:polysaccharide export outer membrane protein